MATRKGERPDPVQRDAGTHSEDARSGNVEDRFRVVVKRLLDTPPMHRPASKGKQTAKRAPKRAEK
jgi:hypothetical protein